jgi:pimeloyl-ACP methyl ester carboxylesterase
MDVLPTPDERFSDLPGWPYAPSYTTTSDGLRLAYVDEGTGPTVLMLHGEPSWGYLYRHLVPVLVHAGFRCVVPDLVGFGRSDKPAAVEDYTYGRGCAGVPQPDPADRRQPGDARQPAGVGGPVAPRKAGSVRVLGSGPDHRRR